jgi:hypothetical protein
MGRRRLAIVSSLALVSAFPGAAFATNGYFTAGVGAVSQSLAGL